ncbi:MAG: cytochrome c oxidase accessory protein CcoG [Planctomycetota bacterium]
MMNVNTNDSASAGGCGSCANCSCSGDEASSQLPVLSVRPVDSAKPRETPGPADDSAGATTASPSSASAVLPPQEHVLSTLEQDGSRRWLRPMLAKGPLWRRRRYLGFALIAFFVVLPHLRIGGRPVVLLDIAAREFTFVGHTFLPTDTMLLALAMIGVFVSIAFLTAVGGRLWCGWACPQTVYMEFVFRPIDRFFEGTIGRGGKARNPTSVPMRALRLGVYFVLSAALANTFLAYFVGTERLWVWMRSSPIQHPAAFFVMAGTTIAMLFDFLFFREQLCLIACPYGRFQSVMLDRKSLIVGYDVNRGEPRGKMRKKKVEAESSPKGDCIDCHKCVAVCPTGIDIRKGLQMECINCTQCIDVCNEVMEKIGRAPNLIGFTSQDQLAGKSSSWLRPRTILYPLVLCGIAIAFGLVLSSKYAFDARPLRALGNPYTRLESGRLQNSLKLRLVNRSGQRQTYVAALSSPSVASLTVLDDSAMTLEPGGTVIVPLSIDFPPSLTQGIGSVQAEVQLADQSGNERVVNFRLLGPR